MTVLSGPTRTHSLAVALIALAALATSPGTAYAQVPPFPEYGAGLEPGAVVEGGPLQLTAWAWTSWYPQSNAVEAAGAAPGEPLRVDVIRGGTVIVQSSVIADERGLARWRFPDFLVRLQAGDRVDASRDGSATPAGSVLFGDHFRGVWPGGESAELIDTLVASGASVIETAVPPDRGSGRVLVYISGAPLFVNRAFLDAFAGGVPAGTPFMARYLAGGGLAAEEVYGLPSVESLRRALALTPMSAATRHALDVKLDGIERLPGPAQRGRLGAFMNDLRARAGKSLATADAASLLAQAAAVSGVLPATPGMPGRPGDECAAPPAIAGIQPAYVVEPAEPGQTNTGTFRIRGTHFEQGQVYTDGPLLLVGESQVNPAANQIARDYLIGWGAPEPGSTFRIFVVTPCGSDAVEVEIR